MRCSHCSITVKFNWRITSPLEENREKEEGIEIFYAECPNCNKLVIGIQKGKLEYDTISGIEISEVYWHKIVYPKQNNLQNSDYIPVKYLEDYEESINCLSLSPKASAALSRRLLQNILREHFEIKENNLATEIDKFTKLPEIPSHITDAVDAVRLIGNIAAHPTKNKNTGEIVPVEPGEAEWLIEVNEALFDFVFIQPIKLNKRKEELNAKLLEIGKPIMK